MVALFYISGVVAALSTVLAVASLNAFHSLLFLVLSLLSVAVALAALGAPFVAAIEVIIYAGAIVVLLVFAVMTLNVGDVTLQRERTWLSPVGRAVATAVALVLIAEIAYFTISPGQASAPAQAVEPKLVSMSLFGPYVLGVELVSLLLLGALVAAFHVGWRRALE